MSEFNENQIIDSEQVEAKRGRFMSTVAEYAELLAISMLIVVLVLTFAFRLCTVDGNSMYDTLCNEEVLVVSPLFYTPQRGDIVVIHQTSKNYNKPIVKRVIGLGGDTVVINHDTNEITVTDKSGNTETLNESDYLTLRGEQIYHGTTTYKVPEKKIFVLGDNRNESMDSRDGLNMGYIDSKKVLGKVLFRIAPLSRLGAIK